MKKLMLLSAVAVIAVSPATAIAKRIQHVGKIEGSDDSKIRLRVTKKQGEVRKVSGFRAEGAQIRCESGNFSLRFEIKGAIKVRDKGSFKARVPSSENPKEKVRVSGRVKGGGKRVVGNLKTNELTRNGESCTVPKQRFSTRKR